MGYGTGAVARVSGVMVGLVSDVNDPEQLSRVKLRFPQLPTEHESGWASIAGPLGGRERGFYYLPEVDDEALVVFDNGDFDHPYVIGFLHNGVDRPPLQGGIDQHVRRVRSVSGHVIDLDDRAGHERVVVTSQGGQKIMLTDAPARIEVATRGGATVVVSDTPGSVTVRSRTGMTVEVTSTGVTVTGTNITLSAPLIKLDGAMVTASGVIQCGTLVTQSVVSASYTPGVGNLL